MLNNMDSSSDEEITATPAAIDVKAQAPKGFRFTPEEKEEEL